MGQCCITVSTTSEIGVIKSGLQNYNKNRDLIQTIHFFSFQMNPLKKNPTFSDDLFFTNKHVDFTTKILI